MTYKIGVSIIHKIKICFFFYTKIGVVLCQKLKLAFFTNRINGKYTRNGIYSWFFYIEINGSIIHKTCFLHKKKWRWHYTKIKIYFLYLKLISVIMKENQIYSCFSPIKNAFYIKNRWWCYAKIKTCFFYAKLIGVIIQENKTHSWFFHPSLGQEIALCMNK